MNTQLIIRRVAGFMILLSITLSHYHHSNWIYLAVFVGFNLFQSSFTKFCPLEIALNKINDHKSKQP